MVASIAIDDHAPLVLTRDALSRETRRESAKGFRFDQTWDAVGQVTTQSAGHGASGLSGLAAVCATPTTGTAAERHYAWNKAGEPVCIDDLIWGETHYFYDANGQVAEASFSDGSVEKFYYDAAKNVAGVRLAGPGVGPGLGGLLAWRSTPGGVVQLSRGPSGEMVALTHDVCGRVVKRRVDRRGFRPKTWHYGWDPLDRLVTCETPDGDTWFYRYDPFGRRLTKVRKLRETELAWTAQKFRSLVSKDDRDKTKIWTWPKPPNAPEADKRLPPVIGTYFKWDGDAISEEAPLRLDGSVDWSASVRWHYEPGGFRPFAKQSPDRQLSCIVTDHLGTPREMFDESGCLTWSAIYSTWGAMRWAHKHLAPEKDGSTALYSRGIGRHSEAGIELTSGGECPIRFPGQWADEETDLSYNRHRSYDALTTQYLTPDPARLKGGYRLQSYVETPLIWSDPLGLSKNWEPPQEVKDKIPSEFGEGQPAKKYQGWRWQGKKGDYIRVDRGNPKSPEPIQQKDHIHVQSGGKTLGPDGTEVPGNSPQSHIPLGDWMNWSQWNKP